MKKSTKNKSAIQPYCTPLTPVAKPMHHFNLIIGDREVKCQTDQPVGDVPSNAYLKELRDFVKRVESDVARRLAAPKTLGALHPLR